MWFKKKVVQPTLEQQLVNAEARLARYELLPTGDFTVFDPQRPFQIKHGVDEKPKEIARLKGKIAELKVRLTRDTKGNV